MSAPISITISGNAQDALARINDQSTLSAELRKTMKLENNFTVDVIRQKYLHFPKQGPTTMAGCRIISGRLWKSVIASEPSGDTSTGITSAIGSNVIYARILEEGGDTRPHKIVAKNAKALHFNGLFVRSVNHPGSHFEGRHFIRKGITDSLPDYSAAFTRTILKIWKGESA